MSFKIKLTIIAIGFLSLIVYVVWYSISYLETEKEAVLVVASEEFGCQREDIKIGSSYQYNDGPSEIHVKGCGKEGVVLCYDDTQKYGMLGQYLKFDMDCRMKAE